MYGLTYSLLAHKMGGILPHHKAIRQNLQKFSYII